MIKQSGELLTKEGVSIPLSGVEVRGNITGHSSRVKVIQTYRNTEQKALEVVYKFPLPDDGSICGFKAIIGEKVVQGAIEEKDKAFKEYDEALSKGNIAVLVDQERPNIFTLSLGNLYPGVDASIELEYVTLLDAHNSEVRFVLPTTISPRYLPPDIKDEKGIPSSELINPPVALNVSYGMKIFLEILGRDNIQTLESPSHHITTSFQDNSILIELSSEKTSMDRDFVLNIKYRKDFETAGYGTKKDKAYYVQLDFSPKLPPESITRNISNHEIVFVLDCSYSMAGSSIIEAKQGLEILLKAMPLGTSFNIFRFGSTFSSLFNTSVTYDSQTLNTALKYLAKIEADLGGTEILAPLQAIKRSLSKGKKFSVVLLTDGQVGNEEQIVDLVRNSGMRMFTIGIGNGPNEFFIKQLARTTGGAVEMISPNERIESRLLRLFNKISTTHNILDFKVEWGATVIATNMPDTVFSGETVSIFAKLEDSQPLPEKIVLSGLVNKSRQEWVARITFGHEDSVSLPYLWARARIRELEESETAASGSLQIHRKEEKTKQAIIDLSKNYDIISRETSFLAVVKCLDPAKTTGEIILKKVPVMLTHGWGGVKHDGVKIFRRFSTDIEAVVFDEGDSSDSIHNTCIPDRQFEFFAKRRIGYSDNLDQDSWLKILALQKAEGGFEIDEVFAQILKVSLGDLLSLANKIQAKDKPEEFILLSTAIILRFLENNYADSKTVWEAVTKKSQSWLQDQIRKTEPTIEGRQLVDWVDQFLKQQGLI